MSSFILPSEELLASVVDDPLMGRCLAAVKQHAPGDVIFEEDAFVFASSDPLVSEMDDEIIIRAFRGIPGIVSQLEEMVCFLSALDRVQCVDTARCFLQLIGIHILQSAGVNLQLDRKLDLFSKLTFVNLDDCLENIKLFRSKFPRVIPSSISDLTAATFLAKLNTNQVELEDLGGSGLFVFTAILQHSCLPNCSYSTHGNHLYLTAISNILEGDRLSIDYANCFYHPTSERQAALNQSYNFLCDCIRCAGYDHTRGFCCQNSICSEGVVYPLGTGFEGDWTCNRCGKVLDLEERKLLLDHELRVMMDPPESTEALEEVLTCRVIHASHHLIFWAREDISQSLTAEARKSGLTSDYALALEETERVVAMLETALPPVHFEKVVHYDRLAQLAVASGQIEKAKESFGKAYAMSCLSCGQSVPGTMLLKEMWLNCPTTAEELLERYGGVLSEADGGDDGDEQWEDEEEDENGENSVVGDEQTKS